MSHGYWKNWSQNPDEKGSLMKLVQINSSWGALIAINPAHVSEVLVNDQDRSLTQIIMMDGNTVTTRESLGPVILAIEDALNYCP